MGGTFGDFDGETPETHAAALGTMTVTDQLSPTQNDSLGTRTRNDSTDSANSAPDGTEREVP